MRIRKFFGYRGPRSRYRWYQPVFCVGSGPRDPEAAMGKEGRAGTIGTGPCRSSKKRPMSVHQEIMLTKPLPPLTKPLLFLTPAAIYNIIVLNTGMRAPRSAPEPPRWSACIRQHTSAYVIIRQHTSLSLTILPSPPRKCIYISLLAWC
jgi:hypothetical protein